MNNNIYNEASEPLESLVYGRNNMDNLTFSTDANGLIILSNTLNIDTVASDLGIRPLQSSRDSASITSSTVNIRNLDGSRDGILRPNSVYTENSETGTIVALGTRIFLTTDISLYGQNTFYVRNIGGVLLSITFQIAPIDQESYYINDGSSFNLLVGGQALYQPSNLMKYARVRASATLLGNITVYYLGQN